MATAVARKLDSIRESGGIRAREIAQLLETTPQTVSRWQTGRSTPRPNSLDRLLRLEWLAGQLAQVYPPDDARVWLFSPHTDLDGERPVDSRGRQDGQKSSRLSTASNRLGHLFR